MFQCVATMWYNNTPVLYHLFPVPTFGEPAFQKSIKAYEKFRKVNNGDLYKRTLAAHKPGATFVPPPIRGSLKDKDEWDVDRHLLIESCLRNNLATPDEPDWICHDNIFEFFEAVGYDHKAHRWIRPEDREAHFHAKVATQMEASARSFANDAKRHCIRR